MLNLLSFVLAASLSTAAKAQAVEVTLPITNGIISPDGFTRP
jgi:hypothetical protein